MDKMLIRRAAILLRVNPRTVARAINPAIPNVHIHPETYVDLTVLAFAYGCSIDIFKLAQSDNPEHKLLKPFEAASYIDIPIRTFRHYQKRKKIRPVLKNKATVRYTKNYLNTLDLEALDESTKRIRT